MAHCAALCKQCLDRFDLSSVKAIGLDETACKRGHNYVTIFIDMQRTKEAVLFVTPGKGKEVLVAFSEFLSNHHGSPQNVLEVVCDMSPAFISGVSEQLPNAEITVDWFHIVQIFTRALGEVRKQENRVTPLPKHLRWAVLKKGDTDNLTINQLKAMAELLKPSESLPRERFWDIQVTKIDSQTRQPLISQAVLRPCRSAKTSQARSWLHNTPTNDWTRSSYAYFISPLALAHDG